MPLAWYKNTHVTNTYRRYIFAILLWKNTLVLFNICLYGISLWKSWALKCCMYTNKFANTSSNYTMWGHTVFFYRSAASLDSRASPNTIDLMSGGTSDISFFDRKNWGSIIQTQAPTTLTSKKTTNFQTKQIGPHSAVKAACHEKKPVRISMNDVTPRPWGGGGGYLIWCPPRLKICGGMCPPCPPYWCPWIFPPPQKKKKKYIQHYGIKS